MAPPQPNPPPYELSTFEKEARVLVGTTGYTDKLGKFQENTDPTDYGPWTDYQIINKYEKDGHIYMMGLTSPNGITQYIPGSGNKRDTVAFCQLSMPTLLWISDWTVSKYNNKPLVPKPMPFIGDWVLMDEHYETAMLTLAPDGVTPSWRISGTFTYGHRNPSAVTSVIELVEFGRPPWVMDEFSEFGGRSGNTEMFMTGLNTALQRG